MTDPCLLYTIDLYTVTIPELAFVSKFSLTAQRDDFVHALIAWFDIDFTACHKPIKFSTGPHSKYTHWKQTVFYLKGALTLEEGERIVGTLSSHRNATKPRDLDIRIDYESITDNPLRQSKDHCEYKM